MRALCWYGKEDVRVETVPDPGIVNSQDAIVRVSRTAICGSDLHLYDGYIPAMQRGDVLGHEFMGEIVETGRDVHRVSVGDRVVVPFTISCGRCEYCRRELWSLCDNTNPNAALAKAGYGDTGSGLFGYSHLLGGYAGGQAEYVRVPFADVGCLKIESDIDDEKVLFLSDILPTAYQAVEQCQPRKGQVLAIWGLGPVGQLAVTCGKLFDFEQIIAIDDVPERLEMARANGATVINMREHKILDALDDLTAGRGPDACIDAVGMEGHGTGVTNAYDRAKQSLRLQTDRPTALREAIFACRKGGVVSAPGVYGGFIDKMPFGAAFAKGLTFKMGQTHMHRYMKPLLDRVTRGEINPTFLITHRMSLDEAPRGYREFRDKHDGCIKVVLQP